MFMQVHEVCGSVPGVSVACVGAVVRLSSGQGRGSPPFCWCWLCCRRCCVAVFSFASNICYGRRVCRRRRCPWLFFFRCPVRSTQTRNPDVRSVVLSFAATDRRPASGAPRETAVVGDSGGERTRTGLQGTRETPAVRTRDPLVFFFAPLVLRGCDVYAPGRCLVLVHMPSHLSQKFCAYVVRRATS